MSDTTIKTVKLSRPQPFMLNGSALEVGGQLAEHLLREPLYSVMREMPKEKHEALLAGVLCEFLAVTVKALGKRSTASMLRSFAERTETFPADVAAAAGIPSDPEVH